jgi:hypothetical protein
MKFENEDQFQGRCAQCKIDLPLKVIIESIDKVSIVLTDCIKHPGEGYILLPLYLPIEYSLKP